MATEALPNPSLLLPPPPPMQIKGNTRENWKTYKSMFTDYCLATGLSTKPDNVQAATLKTIMGLDLRKRLESLKLSDAELSSVTTIFSKLDDIFEPARNVVYDRYVFFKAEQLDKESTEAYLHMTPNFS